MALKSDPSIKSQSESSQVSLQNIEHKNIKCDNSNILSEEDYYPAKLNNAGL